MTAELVMPGVPRIQFVHVSKQYPGVQALADVTFDIALGEIHALVGENGAGKSTLVKILSGATQPNEGKIRVDGRDAEIRSVRSATALGIAVVHQEFNLAPDLTVAENVFLGRWPTRLGVVDFAALHRKAGLLFASLGCDLSTHQKVSGLSVAGQQMVEIARALSLEAKVLLLDEPSAVLSPHEVTALFAIVRRLAAEGLSVLYISHRLDEIFALCDRVTVLRDGRHISTRPVAQVDRDLLIREMVGRPIGEEFPTRRTKLGKTALRVEGLSVGKRCRGVSFEVCEGEVFALTGLVGSGRSTVGGALFGAETGVAGVVHTNAANGPFRSPRQARRGGIALVPEDRRNQGLLLERSVGENLSLANLESVATAGVLRPKLERSMAQRWMQQVHVRATGPEAIIATLSGGNQQKVMIARWLQTDCRVIILDEPTRGVDVGAKVEIYAIINQLAYGGTAVVMITSELPEAIGMADRIGVMGGGSLTAILDNRDRSVTQETILKLAVPPSGKADAVAATG